MTRRAYPVGPPCGSADEVFDVGREDGVITVSQTLVRRGHGPAAVPLDRPKSDSLMPHVVARQAAQVPGTRLKSPRERRYFLCAFDHLHSRRG
eukprot:15447674-Heterocapsa_arctica.AAC.1